MFLTDIRNPTGGPQDLIEVLNDERAFLPFHSDAPDVDVWVVNKSHIVRVHLPSEAGFQPEPSPGESSSDCTLVLGDRSKLFGRLLLSTPSGSSRLVDKLNLTPTFVTFVTDDGVDFVHREHITQVFRNK